MGDVVAAAAVALLLLLLLLLPCAADLKDVGRQGKRLHTHTRARRHTRVHSVYTRTHTGARAPSRPEPARASRAAVRHEDVQASRTGGNRRATPTSFCRQYFHYVCVWVHIIMACVCVYISYSHRHTHDTR